MKNNASSVHHFSLQKRMFGVTSRRVTPKPCALGQTYPFVSLPCLGDTCISDKCSPSKCVSLRLHD